MGSNPASPTHCGVAKLVRHLTLNEKSTGSNPVSTTNKMPRWTSGEVVALSRQNQQFNSATGYNLLLGNPKKISYISFESHIYI